MSNKVLVTDSLFILDEHVKRLEDAGFKVERLDKPEATEAELCEAIKGKVGYILGGVEHVTEKVINAADELKAIVFTGADWAGFIPSHQLATKKDIAIANAPGANAYAVAEYTLSLILLMLRRVLELGNTGDKTFMTTQSLQDTKVGIIGLGRIGQQVAKMLKGFDADVYYWDRNRKADLETKLNIKHQSLEELLANCDVVTTHVSSQAGQLLNADLLKHAKVGIIFINAGAHLSFDEKALYDLLSSGKARAAFDGPVKGERFKDLPLATWFYSNEGTAYNTFAANKVGSDMATQSIINLLKTGSDKNRVN